MSDSQSSQEHQIKVEQKMQARLRDLLQKAKSITPFYDDDTLLLIYKDCYQADQVFINKLQIIAKNHKLTQEDEDTDWIQFKQHQKANVQKFNHSQSGTKREKYNFLEDKELIERAKRIDIDRQRQNWQRRKNQQYKEKQQNRNRGNNQAKLKYQEKPEIEEKDHQPQQEKKLKYKEKVEQKSQVSKIEEVSIQQNHKKQVQAPKVQQKSVTPQQKFKKVTQNKKVQQSITATQQINKTISQNNKTDQNPIVNQQTIKPIVKYTEKKEQKPEKNDEVKPLPTKTQVVQSKVIYIQKPVENSQKQSTQEIKKQPIVHYKPKQSISTKSLEKKQTKQAVQKNLKISQQISQSEKNIYYQQQLEEDPLKRFEESCKQNSYILKFIKPTGRLQKVSYIRDPKGAYRDIKTRQMLGQRN